MDIYKLLINDFMVPRFEMASVWLDRHRRQDKDSCKIRGVKISSVIIVTVTMVTFGVAVVAHATSVLRHNQGELEQVTTTRKVVALTFDADMTPKMLRELRDGKVASWYNEDVIAVLEKENVPATLFLTGMWIETYATTTRELSSNPLFEIGNHSYSHGGFSSPCRGLNKMKESQDVPEIEKTDALLKKFAISYKKYFRFPGLCYDADDVRKAQNLGYTVIGGDIHAGDGFQSHADRIITNVVTHVRPGSIIVLHMNGGLDAPKTADALPGIIAKLKAEGYSFLKVSDLIRTQ